MKSDTPLDYAVFQLNETQSRCELWICAGEKNEKLASGSLKPFVTHLRAAKEQLANGSTFIILQAPPFVGDGSPWFTKRTIERFVRFVSTPDVLEGVSVLEAELSRLDDATNILISDSSWACDPFLKSCPVTPRTGSLLVGTENTGDVTKTYTRRPSLDYGGVALLDGSKRDLLKAMETRRIMLAHEQKKAFAHATAAGFNVSGISDLMVFANCFGAPRLWEACLKFMTLCKKKQESTGEEPYIGTPVGSSDSSIHLVSNEASESSDSSVSGTSKTKARKTWDPQVMATLQQLYSRKVENGSLMSPDGKKITRKQKQEPSPLGEVDLVVGARESVCLLDEHTRARSKVDDKRISVQDAISLFESKQQKLKQDEASKRKALKDAERPTDPAVPEAATVEKQMHETQANLSDETGKPCPAEAPVHCDKAGEQVEGNSQSSLKAPNALAVVSEATELEELDSIEWKPLSRSSGYIFDDMFLEQKGAATENSRRQSLCVWKTAWDNEFEPPGSGTPKACGPKGRFYDQYQEKREAKLKHEPTVKKAEKEAKLKAMQDVLEKRKAELSTRSSRFSDKNSATKSYSSRKEGAESKSCELARLGSKRSSTVTSVHSTPPASKQESGLPRTISSRKPSPSSQKSSTATTPRALHEPKLTLNRIQRRSAESLYPEQGKENVDPVYSSDIEIPQHLKYLERKNKAAVLATKKNPAENIQVKREQQDSKPARPDNAVQKKGKQSPQSRQTTGFSAVKGSSEASKLQRTRSDVSVSSVSSDILLPLKLDNDDAESSCSCPPVGNVESLRPVDSVELTELRVTLLQLEDQLVALKDTETSARGNDAIEAGNFIKDKACDIDEHVVELDDKPEMKPEAQAQNDEESSLITKVEAHVRIEEVQAPQVGDDHHVAVPLVTPPTPSVPCQGSEVMPNAETDVVCEATAPAEVEVSIDLDVLIEELAKDEVQVMDEESVQLKEAVAESVAKVELPTQKNAVIEMPAKATPLFELAELDHKQFPAAFKLDPPLEDMSSSTRTESKELTTTSNSLQRSFESDTETVCSSNAPVGSFIPRTLVAADGQVQKCILFPGMLSRKSSHDAARASSEPGSPNKLPLFDLLVTEQNTNNHEANTTTPAITVSNNKALKSSSHKLPHMCRLPSPDTRGSENKKLLHKSAGSAPKLADASSSKPSKEPFKSFKKLLRFGRKSSSSTSERVMWQNGWFRGE